MFDPSMYTKLFNQNPVQKSVKGIDGHTYFLPPKSIKKIPTEVAGALPEKVFVINN